MIKRTKWVAPLMGLLLWGAGSIPAFGVELGLGTIVGHYRVRRTDLPIYQVAEIEADNTTEGMDGFAKKVAPVLYAWTKAHYGVEANGNICHTPDGTRWGVRLLTWNAHTGSPRTNACPAGMVTTGVDIHSHPQKHTYLPNGVDHLFLHYGLGGSDLVGTEPDTYSPEDLANGPGYLVGAVALHFQDGKGNVRIVEPLPR